MPAALDRRDGAYLWRVSNNPRARFRAVDATEIEAYALSPDDVVGLATEADAPNIQFDLTLRKSSTYR